MNGSIPLLYIPSSLGRGSLYLYFSCYPIKYSRAYHKDFCLKSVFKSSLCHYFYLHLIPPLRIETLPFCAYTVLCVIDNDIFLKHCSLDCSTSYQSITGETQWKARRWHCQINVVIQASSWLPRNGYGRQ